MLNFLSVEEVVERIKTADTADTEASAAVAATSPRLRPESQPHRPEYYVPKLTRRLLNP
jgi:hypothetical protein